MLVEDKYGAGSQAGADGTCWIKPRNSSGAPDAYQLTFFVPLLFYVLVCIVALVYLRMRTQPLMGGKTGRSKRRLFFRLQLFVALFIVCWIGPIVHRTIVYMRVDRQSWEWLRVWDAAGQSFSGFLNAVVWLSNPHFFRPLNSLVRTVVPFYAQFQDRAHEYVPVLKKLHKELEDEGLDIQRFDVLLRKSIIISLLQGASKAYYYYYY